MDPSRVKQVYILRHGQTAWTVTGQHTGLTDIDLTENGIREAELLGKSLKKIRFDHVLCSPLMRAKRTCAIVGYEKVAQYDPDLLEWNYGDYEGMTSKEIRKNCPHWTIFTKDPPHGEKSSEVGTRADRIINKIINLEGTVALFSSGHISRVIGARWIALPVSAGQHLLLSTGSKSILGFERENPVIELWNDTSHLTE